jgi:hypothetical protein
MEMRPNRTAKGGCDATRGLVVLVVLATFLPCGGGQESDETSENKQARKENERRERVNDAQKIDWVREGISSGDYCLERMD